ncbi:hypothetical protein AYI70_g1399 [Smittium culicis]|uniref:Uncharacterized protein n=1 Tax=Smittium culicis TaxID=133412 RepID=A0A1R1YCW2_9FUNG|nr:hypothetical protein AYI70_g11619 [Smittium culicis]OMJ24710.1 hypothetical protein AYI70_g1399 [Smittium culicis]
MQSADRLKEAMYSIKSFLNSESSYLGAELVNKDYNSTNADIEDLDSGEDDNLSAFGNGDEDYVDEGSDDEIDFEPSSVFENISNLLGYSGDSDDVIQAFMSSGGENAGSKVAFSGSIDGESLDNTGDISCHDSKFKIGDKYRHSSKEAESASQGEQPDADDSSHKNADLLTDDNKAKGGSEGLGRIGGINSDEISSNEEEFSDGDDSGSGSGSEDDSDVDIETNMVKNLIESFKSQQGLSGPAGVLFNQFSYIPPKE